LSRSSYQNGYWIPKPELLRNAINRTCHQRYIKGFEQRDPDVTCSRCGLKFGRGAFSKSGFWSLYHLRYFYPFSFAN